MSSLLNNDSVLTELERLTRLARYGDSAAYRMLHAVLGMHLGDAAVSGEIHPAVARMLADMHGSIGAGQDVEIAMIAKSPQSRPVKLLRDDRIISLVDSFLACFQSAEDNRAALEAMGIRLPAKRPSMRGVYKLVAAAFGLQDHKQVERIHKAAAKKG